MSSKVRSARARKSTSRKTKKGSTKLKRGKPRLGKVRKSSSHAARRTKRSQAQQKRQTKTTTPLRQRMLEDLKLAGFAERTQECYLRAVRKLAEHYRQS